MSTDNRAVVIGASHAAVQLMISLRQHGWEGSITVVFEHGVTVGKSLQPFFNFRIIGLEF